MTSEEIKDGGVIPALVEAVIRMQEAQAKGIAKILAQTDERIEMERKSHEVTKRQLFAALKPQEYSQQRSMEPIPVPQAVPDHQDPATVPGNGAPVNQGVVGQFQGLQQRMQKVEDHPLRSETSDALDDDDGDFLDFGRISPEN